MKPRLLEKYKKQIIPEMMKIFGFKNTLQVAKINKIVINMGVGQAITDIKILESAMANLAMITGQKPVMTRAKKAIANFKLREGLPIGCKVTLRGNIMYEFLDRLISAAIPRIKDFRGVSGKSFDGTGNYAFGITEQMVFPEIDYDLVLKTQGMDIIIATTASNDLEAYELLKLMGMPFRQ